MSGHRFQVGDMVAHVAAVAQVEVSSGQAVPLCKIVLEKITQECPGGIQYKYGLSEQPNHVLDHELVAWTDAVEAVRAFRAKSRAEKEAQEAASWDRLRNAMPAKPTE